MVNIQNEEGGNDAGLVEINIVIVTIIIIIINNNTKKNSCS